MLPDQVITSVDQVTTAWLSAALARSGALTQGMVTAFAVDRGQGNWSTNGSLSLRYSEDARGLLPPRLFLKLVSTAEDDGESFGDSEVTYYVRDYTDVVDSPLLRCYDAAYSAALARYHLLLEDVSATHVPAAEKAPTLEYGLELAEGLAVLHARWWGAQRLAEAQQGMHGAAHVRRFVEISEPGVGYILARLAGRCAPHWPAALADLYARHPQALIKRSQDENGFTLIHGDAGQHNILVPRSGDRPLYLIDRQPFNWSLTTWLGVYDLVYALVLDWDIETRRRCEMPILRRYHDRLLEQGVAEYPWAQLVEDYRLCVPMAVYVATEYCRGGLNEQMMHVWWPMLQRALAACDDLHCSALW